MRLEKFDYDVSISTRIYPTEKEKVVRYCIEEIFPVTEWDRSGDMLLGKTDTLEKFAQILEDTRIRDTARDHLLMRVVSDSCTFEISKQATCAGKINFSIIEQPLGSVKVTISCGDIESLIHSLTKGGPVR